MKTRILILAVLLTMAPQVWGASAPYEFTTLDIAVPGRPDLVAFPADINNSGQMIANVRINGGSQVLITGPAKNARKTKSSAAQTVMFGCPGAFETFGIAINDRGQVSGYCDGGGFIREPNGTILLLNVPGADGTLGFGLSTDG